MYSLRLSVWDAESHPVKLVELSAVSDDEAIKLGQAQIAEQVPKDYTLTEVRVCRDEEVIWSAKPYVGN